jgi:hypothetical protein
MSDRELLEAAARAAGLHVWPGHGWQSSILYRAARPHSSGLVSGVEWNPLEDDGDRYRLARATGLRIDWHLHRVLAMDGTTYDWTASGRGDNEAHAIVRAAAAMATAQQTP